MRPLPVFLLFLLIARTALPAGISLTDDDFSPARESSAASAGAALRLAPVDSPADPATAPAPSDKTLSESLMPIDIMVDLISHAALRNAISGGAQSFLDAVAEEKYEDAQKKLIDALPADAPADRRPPAFLALAMLCHKARQMDPGLAALTKAEQMRPRDPLIPALQAWFHLDLGEFAAAEKALSRARELDASFTLARIQQARIHTHNRDRERALAEWSKIRRAAPDYPHVDDEIARLELERYISTRSRSYATPHFIAEYEDSIETADRDAVQRILADVDNARAILEKAFRHRPGELTPILIYSDETFRRFFGRNAILGLFHPYDGIIRVRCFGENPPPGEHLGAIIYHEYAHAMLHSLTGGRLTERWLHEGMAMWAERFSGHDPLLRISAADRRQLGANLPAFELMDMWDYGNYLRARIIVDESMRLFGQERFISVFAAMGEGMDLNEALKAKLGMDYVSFTKLVRNRLR